MKKAAAQKAAPVATKKAAPLKVAAKQSAPAVAAEAASAPKKTRAAKKAASKPASLPVAPAAPDLNKLLSHVLASLKKTDSRPARRARLVASVKALIGPAASQQTLDSVLAELLGSGKVIVNASGGVGYAL